MTRTEAFQSGTLESQVQDQGSTSGQPRSRASPCLQMRGWWGWGRVYCRAHHFLLSQTPSTELGVGSHLGTPDWGPLLVPFPDKAESRERGCYPSRRGL
jgi:hypothetical protein